MPTRHWGQVLEPVKTVGHSFVFASLPILMVVAVNIGDTPPERGFTSALVCAWGLAASAMFFSRIFGGSLAARSAWLSALIILLSSYSTILQGFPGSRAGMLHEHPAFAGGYAAAAIAIACAVRRPWDQRTHRTPMLGALALAMFTLSFAPAAWHAARSAVGPWRRATTEFTSIPRPLVAASGPTRDVYYLVLDGLGRQDVLQDVYGVSLAALRLELERQGFYVPTRSRAPYAQTMLSLAATLNMNYLDSIAATIGQESKNRYPLAALLKGNTMMAVARASGYRVISVGSEFAPTSDFDDADNGPAPDGLSDYQQTALAMTPLAALPLDHWTYKAHGRNVVRQFSKLDELASNATAPKFVFAHILVPHPPFVFASDGSVPRRQSSWFTPHDGDFFRDVPETYVPGYAEQVSFVATLLRKFVQKVSEHPGPAPVVVIMGDHGPGSQLRWEDPAATNMTERMSVFSAYRFPGIPPDRFYPTISPVNAARILANTYFGTSLPPLPDRSAFSTWSRPYDFLQLPPEGTP